MFHHHPLKFHEAHLRFPEDTIQFASNPIKTIQKNKHTCNVGPPNVLVWFVNFSNYSYKYHKPYKKVMFTNLAIINERFRMGPHMVCSAFCWPFHQQESGSSTATHASLVVEILSGLRSEQG